MPHRNCGKLIVATTPRRNAKAAVDPRARRSQWRRGPAVAERGRGARRWSRRSTATPPCSRRPPASSTATPTCWRCGRRGSRAHVRLSRAARAARAPGNGIEIEVGGEAPMTLAAACWSTRRDCVRPVARSDRRDADRNASPKRLSRQGKLLQLRGARPFSHADLSGAGARRAGRAPDARHGGPGRSARTSNGSRASTTRSIPPVPTDSIPRSAATGRACRTAR